MTLRDRLHLYERLTLAALAAAGLASLLAPEVVAGWIVDLGAVLASITPTAGGTLP